MERETNPQRSRQKSVGSENSRPGLRPLFLFFKGTDGVLTELGSGRMVGEWMMDPIKIPWFRHPGPSWSLVYLVRGGSRPNLTEGSLSAAMGCFVQGYLDLMPLGSIRALAITIIWWCHLAANHLVQRAPSHNRLSCGAIWRQNRRSEDTYHVLAGKRLFENGS
ncbi:hypothetical protein M5K25_004712 [Dendrobium thyrsiflorum]|uniref:Uncharacterized protein n=1 Tax=Dendrobium thyrsiflorum TaxID=117978 RepID=A0ABD0VFV5_DENTH